MGQGRDEGTKQIKGIEDDTMTTDDTEIVAATLVFNAYDLAEGMVIRGFLTMHDVVVWWTDLQGEEATLSVRGTKENIEGALESIRVCGCNGLLREIDVKPVVLYKDAVEPQEEHSVTVTVKVGVREQKSKVEAHVKRAFREAVVLYEDLSVGYIHTHLLD